MNAEERLTFIMASLTKKKGNVLFWGNSERGFSLIEFLVTIFLLVVLVLIGFRSLVENAKVAKAQKEIVVMEQGARTTLDMIVRDLLIAGYGMRIDDVIVDGIVPNVPPFNFDPDENPDGITTFRADAITLRANTMDINTELADDMPQPSSELKCVESSEFVDGDWCIIFDKTGAWDIFTVTNVQESNHLQHNPPPNYHQQFCKAYKVEDHPLVVKIHEIRYEFLANTGEIVRTVNSGDPYTIARNVEALEFTYYDNSFPPTAFEPRTYSDRRIIRDVGIMIRSRTAHRDLGLKDYRRFTLSTTVSPRNLPLNGD